MRGVWRRGCFLNPHPDPLPVLGEGKNRPKGRSIFDAQDAIEKQRDDLIGQIEGQLKQKCSTERIFSIRWKLGCEKWEGGKWLTRSRKDAKGEAGESHTKLREIDSGDQFDNRLFFGDNPFALKALARIFHSFSAVDS